MLNGKYWKIPYYLGLTKVPTAPLYVNVEPAGNCNLRCPWCSSKHRDNKNALMDLDLFRRIVADAKSAGVVSISLWLSGEPMIHPRIAEMVSIVEAAGMVSGMHTNATMLTEERAKALLDAGLSQISFSLDGIDRESYEAARVGADYERTVRHMRRFLELKAERGTKKPHAIVQTILPFEPHMRDANGWINYPEPPAENRALFAGLPVDEFRVILPHNWAGEVAGEGLGLRPPGRAYHPCQHLWMGLSVNFEGKVFGCCTDLNGMLIRGDLSRGERIADIWNDETTQLLRRLHVRGEYRKIPLCRECTQVWENEHPLRTELRQSGVLRPLVAARRRLRGQG